MGTGKAGISLNSIIERPNRTIANSVHAKLLNAVLSDKFWCHAAEDSNFKLGRMLHTATKTTPYQAWSGTKPELADMKIRGCHVYVVGTNVSHTKFSNRTYIDLFMMPGNPLRLFWIQTVKEQYDKNVSYHIFSRPMSKSSMPSNTMILKSVLAPTVKPTDILSLWKINIRHCVNGKPMKGIGTYGATRASTVHPDTVRFQLTYTSSQGFTHI